MYCCCVGWLAGVGEIGYKTGTRPHTFGARALFCRRLCSLLYSSPFDTRTKRQLLFSIVPLGDTSKPKYPYNRL
jgi:hypothetical protein